MMQKEIIHNNQIKNDSFPTILCFFSRRPWETSALSSFSIKSEFIILLDRRVEMTGWILIVVEWSVGCVLVSCY